MLAEMAGEPLPIANYKKTPAPVVNEDKANKKKVGRVTSSLGDDCFLQ